jgi:hypothetical protein
VEKSENITKIQTKIYNDFHRPKKHTLKIELDINRSI